MALLTKVSEAARNAMCNALVDLVDGGAAAGYIQVRSGAAPANPAAANSGSLLGTLAMSDPAFGNSGAVNPGEAVAAAITPDSSADTSADAGHFRVFDSNNVCIFQGNAGEAADAPVNMLFNEKTIVAGGTISISAFTVTVPESGA